MELRSPDPESIRDAVRSRYEAHASGTGAPFSYPTGREGAERLGYDPAILARIPEDVLAGFCGVGNPFSLGPVGTGAAVLDIGCGTGVDLFTASSLAGPGARVRGIDLTPAMAARANASLARSGLDIEVRVAGAEAIPYGDGSFDLAISNGVLNLSADKAAAFREIRRVLRPGGRLLFADIVRRGDLPPETFQDLDAWSH